MPDAAEPFAARAVPSHTTFKPDILAGKVLFCTGGGSGICYRIVEVLMAHGASAAIMGRKADRLSAAAADLSKSTKGKCIATPGDVRNYDDVVKAVEETVKTFGRLDMVVCGAAGNFLAPIEGISPRGFKTVQEIDLMGTYHTVKASLEHLKRFHGSYVHISATLHCEIGAVSFWDRRWLASADQYPIPRACPFRYRNSMASSAFSCQSRRRRPVAVHCRRARSLWHPI